ncbi:hypothetical protein TNCV_4904121 [Trichonephila clavipes]|nr:hypothetical protein TNCV_4904121 [Trichonephila clavipes]
MSRSPPDRMLFRRTTLSSLDRCNLWPRAPESYLLSLRSWKIRHRTTSVCDGIKLSFQRTPSYQSVPLRDLNSDGEFCIFCLHTSSLAKIFAENPARFIHCHDTAIPGLRIRLSDGITSLGRHFLTNLLCYFVSSSVLTLVGGRVHLDDSELHRKGRSEMPLLSEAPLVLNLATMSKFGFEQISSARECFSLKLHLKSNNLFSLFLAPFVLMS